MRVSSVQPGSRRPRRALERLERRTALGLLIVQALAPGTLPTPVAGRRAGCRGITGPVPQPLSMNAFGEQVTRLFRAPVRGRRTAGAGPPACAAGARVPWCDGPAG